MPRWSISAAALLSMPGYRPEPPAGQPFLAPRPARHPSVPDVVPETAGLLVAPDDTQALTEALRQILTSEALRRRLQAGARQAAATLPTWTDAATIVALKLEEVSSS